MARERRSSTPDVRPTLSLPSPDPASRASDSIEDALLTWRAAHATGDDVETRVGLGADLDAAEGERVERWSDVVELEGDGVLELHGPSIVDLLEPDGARS